MPENKAFCRQNRALSIQSRLSHITYFQVFPGPFSGSGQSRPECRTIRAYEIHFRIRSEMIHNYFVFLHNFFNCLTQKGHNYKVSYNHRKPITLFNIDTLFITQASTSRVLASSLFMGCFYICGSLLFYGIFHACSSLSFSVIYFIPAAPFIILPPPKYTDPAKRKKAKSPRLVRRESFFALFSHFSEHFLLELICIGPP